MYMVATLTMFIYSNTALALTGVGSEEICRYQDATTADQWYRTDSNDYEAQTFVLDSAVTVSAIKINAFRNDAAFGSVVPIYILGTTSNAPNFSDIQATATIDTQLLDVYDTGTLSNNQFVCDPDIRPEQVVIFDPAVPLSGSTTYAFVVGPTNDIDDLRIPFLTFNNYWPELGETHWECNAPTACSAGSPATWDESSGAHDVHGMAIFNNIVEVDPVNVDAWLDNLLEQLGLNSPWGKLIFTAIVAVFMFIGLLSRKVPPIFVLALGGLFTAPVYSAGLVPAEIIMTGFGIVGLALILAGLKSARSGDVE